MSIINMIDFYSVVIASAAAMMVGALWYSPLLFAKPWMALAGFTPEEMRNRRRIPMSVLYFVQFLALLLTNMVFARVLSALQAYTIPQALTVAVFIWLGFVAPILLWSILWERRPFILYLIHLGHYLLTLMVSAVFLSTWK